MEISEYQENAHHTAKYPRIIVLKNIDDLGHLQTMGIDYEDITWVYPLLGLCGEIGELANKMKKVIRDKNFVIDADTMKDIVAEKGDIRWYASEFSTVLDLKEDVEASYNLEKLKARVDKGTISGSGDNR